MRLQHGRQENLSNREIKIFSLAQITTSVGSYHSVCRFFFPSISCHISKTFTNHTPKSNILGTFTLVSSHEEFVFFLYLFLSICQRTNQARYNTCLISVPSPYHLHSFVFSSHLILIS